MIPCLLLLPAALSLALFAWLLSLHPTAAGRVYAAYGGVYIFVAILWLWLGSDYSPLLAGLYTVLLFVGGLIDNVLKPVMLGRGVEAPMPVVLLGALGGMVSNGILGMFLGATMLALGYQLFMGWVKSQQPPVETADAIAQQKE